jgi:tetratricopeptide (TPR) repeat protein
MLLAPDSGFGSEEEIVMAAADQSAEFGAWAEGTNSGPVTLEQLHDQVRQLANRHTTPAVLFHRALAIRNQTFDLLEGHQQPSQSRDLYAVAGWLCALLSLASNDLGHYDAAEIQARTAWLCAEVADHNNLRAWARVVQANAAFWRGDVLRAAQLAENGLQYARTGTVAIQLACIRAANLAQLGRTDEATTALQQVHDGRERLSSIDEIGGALSCPPLRQYGYTGAANLRLGQPAEALAEFDRALVQESTAPDAFDLYSTTSLIRADAVRGHLRLRQLDAAEEMIRPVLDLPPNLRNDPIVQRVGAISDLLGGQDWRSSPRARQLQDEIAAYRGDSAARRALPATSA